MKLFLVIYIFNQVGGFAGPLPYDLNECIARRDQMRLKQAIGLEAGIDRTTGKPLSAAQIQSVKSLTFQCEERVTAPVLGETRS